MKNIAIIGDGGWGTTLAIHLVKKGYRVTLWGPFPEYLKEVEKKRVNSRYLPGIRIPRQLVFEKDITKAVAFGDLLVFAVPSQFARSVLRNIKKSQSPISQKCLLSVTKGIDTKSLLRISQIVHEELGNIPFAVLSGPTIAREVAVGIPSTAVVASKNRTLAKKIQTIFNSTQFRIYTNSDVIGVELGGSLKNVIAIACGVCDGLHLGTNTKAAILTRGLAEMARLGKAMGAQQSTLTGLSGLGDLATTCFSPQSRNRTVGERLGKGEGIRKILGSLLMVAEGVETARAVYRLSKKYAVPMPITTEVYHIIFKGKKPHQAVADLMKRRAKPE